MVRAEGQPQDDERVSDASVDECLGVVRQGLLDEELGACDAYALQDVVLRDVAEGGGMGGQGEAGNGGFTALPRSHIW